MPEKKSRKRGDELTDEIYKVALEIVRKDGYMALNFNEVAKRAETSRSVLYRRWDTPFELMFEAARHGVPERKASDFDTGSLRGDLLAILNTYWASTNARMGFLAVATALEVSRGNQAVAKRIQNIRDINKTRLNEIFDRAIERDEMKRYPAEVVYNVVLNHIRLVVMWDLTVTKEDIVSLVDDVWMPSILTAQAD
ncbi:MAG: TetR/AcrR family transcriptional regulator [Lactobacillaceae bacterium]|jgi:AcrR family transcriptional regulator|nr:TetR/AcrR family transcriptional regulator [Lactobacillaceae bacterium]